MHVLMESVLINTIAAGIFAIGIFTLSWIWRAYQLAHVLWVIVLVKLLMPPVMFVSLPIGFVRLSPSAKGLSAATIVADATPQRRTFHAEEEPLPSRPTPGPIAAGSKLSQGRGEGSTEASWTANIQLGLLGAWLLGSCTWLSVIAVRMHRFQKLVKEAMPVSRQLRAHAASLAKQLRLSKCPDVRLVEAAVPPMVWAGAWRPIVLLPNELVRRMAADELLLLLSHEFAHLRRRDHWVRWLEAAVFVVYWWNPVAWWARHELHKAEEHCCDAWVTWTFPNSANCYADALVSTIEFLSGLDPAAAPLASAFGEAGNLKRRCEMILCGQIRPPISWRGLVCASLVALVILPCSATLSRAQEKSEAKETAEAVPPQDSPVRNDGPSVIRLSTKHGDIEIRQYDPSTMVRIWRASEYHDELELRVSHGWAAAYLGQYEIKIPYDGAGQRDKEMSQQPLAALANQRVNAEVELKVLKAQLQAYEQKPLAEFGPTEPAEALAKTKQMRNDRLAQLRAEIERYQTTTKILAERFEEERKQMSKSGGGLFDLEFQRTELARQEKVFELISARIQALRSEASADKSKSETGEQVQWLERHRAAIREGIERQRRQLTKELTGRDPFNPPGRPRLPTSTEAALDVRMKDGRVSISRDGILAVEFCVIRDRDEP